MTSRGRHPKNAVNAALRGLDPTRFVVEEVHRGHRWGVVRCLVCRETYPIWSTPRVPEDVAEGIRSFVRKHRHQEEG